VRAAISCRLSRGYAPQRFDVYVTCERAIQLRGGLIAELNQLPCMEGICGGRLIAFVSRRAAVAFVLDGDS
jgi:hypothetical protein